MKQRSSSRTIKLSKAFRTVDDDTRRALAEQRLMALEHDNYNEQELNGENHADDNYVSDDSEVPQKKKQKRDKGQVKTKGNVMQTVGQNRELQWLNKPPKSLERVLMDNGLAPDVNYSSCMPALNKVLSGESHVNSGYVQIKYLQFKTSRPDDEDMTNANVNYFSIAAKSRPSKHLRSRNFCMVCGYLGDYTCVRCGARSCSLRCQTSHQETRCLNQSL